MENPASPIFAVAESVSQRFGPQLAVRDVSFEIPPGQFVVLFGPNGAGKSTLLRMMAGLYRPTSGAFHFEPDLDHARIGYVSHWSLLYGELTGRENLLFFARLHGVQAAEERADTLLQKLSLENAAARPVVEYSSGMRQRLTLARALLHEPDFLLLDEPYSGLDQHGNRLLTGLLRQIKAEQKTVMMVTHNLTDGFRLADRVMIMHRGRLLMDADRHTMQPEEFEEIYFTTVGRA